MSETPPVFKPGDILTADQINTWLAEAPEKDVAAFNAAATDLITGLEAAIAKATNTASSPALWIQNGGGPIAN
ncbi:MAG: hypothetical protein MSC45_05335 [Mobiluncus sp.]|uniref:hypothetical protein n=1 Tax=Mobiluncus sp. TaxID=47293 RepID=UPI002588134A|nr:hypothetical protein [Mobiluncus sp.]MCI6584474.1 hypothetical protein [Mobiluncus sp.]